MLLDNFSALLADNLSPHKNMLEINKPRALTGAAKFPKPVASTIANWLHTEENQAANDEQLQFMQSLA